MSTIDRAAVSSNGFSSGSASIALIGRVFIAVLFLLSGIGKVSDPAGTIGYIQSAGLPLAQVGYAIAVFVEIICSIALILGFQTRLVALIMACFTIAAALSFHINIADQSQFINFFKNISIAGGLLQVVAFGGGRFSLDALRRGR